MYFYPASFDENLVLGGEETFMHMYDESDNHYQYGFRFVTFLFDTYGEDIYARIMEAAKAQGFDASYETNNEEAGRKEDTELLKEIIKSQTSEDVFEQFAEWYTNNWSIKGEEFMTQMESMGQ